MNDIYMQIACVRVSCPSVSSIFFDYPTELLTTFKAVQLFEGGRLVDILFKFQKIFHIVNFMFLGVVVGVVGGLDKSASAIKKQIGLACGSAWFLLLLLPL